MNSTSPANPDRMLWLCHRILPEMLVKEFTVKPAEAAAVGDDVLTRATAFASLPQQARRILVAPFLEEVFDHEPAEASLDLLGATTVVVRNSRLEHSHVAGLINDDGLRIITSTAAEPLAHLLAAAEHTSVEAVGPNPFEDLAETYPRAWACLAALADAIDHDNRHRDYHAPDTAGMPSLPQPHEIVPAQPSQTVKGGTISNSVDLHFDEDFVHRLRMTIDGEDGSPGIFWVAALSRFSRNSHKQLRVLELLLSHEATILTTNYMLRPHDVWVRRGPLVKPDSHYPFAGLSQTRGCLGEHRQVRKQVLDTIQQA